MDCTRSLQTGGGDSCQVVFDAAFDAATGFTVGGYVEIKTPAGEMWFKGPVSGPAVAGAAGSETLEVELRSPWWFLERVTYTQPYLAYDYDEPGEEEGDPAIVHFIERQKSRVILGVDEDGEILTTGDQIRAIIDFANLLVTPDIPIGTIMEGIVAPRIEMVDATCAECILQLLRFHPDAVVYCDQNNASGAVNVRLRSSLAELEIDVLDAGVTSISHHTRPDLVPSGVVVHYERTHTVDENEYVDIVDDSAPSEGAADAVGGVHFTISLRGKQVLTQKQKIKTGDIPVTADDADKKWLWIQKHFQGFEDEVNTDYVIGTGSFTQLTSQAEDPEEWPRELLEGSVPEWLDDPVGDGSTTRVAGSVRVVIYLTYKGTDVEQRKKFAPQGRKILVCEVMGTTLDTNVYSQVIGYTQEDTPPTGLALAYYNALTTLQAEGSLSMNEAECSVAYVPGRRLVLTNGPDAGGQSIVQSVTQNVGSGQTSLRFGPFNGGLSPADFIELQRGLTRTLQLSYADPEERTDAQKGVAKSVIKGDQRHPLNNDLSPPPTFPPLFFLGTKKSDTQGHFLAGKVMSTKWDASDTDPKPQKAYEEIDAAAADLTLTVGDKVYCKLTLTSKNYQPKSDLGGPYTSLSATFSGVSITPSFSGAWSGTWSQTSATWEMTDYDLSGLTVVDEEGIPNITGTITLGGETEDAGGLTYSSPGIHRHALGALATATHSLTLNTADLGISGTLAISGQVSVEGEITGVSMPAIAPFTPSGTISITPNTLRIPDTVGIKVTVWEVTTAEIVKEASPTSDETHAYIPLGEAVTDGADGWIWEQHHTGCIFWTSPPAVVTLSDAGGEGP